MLTQADACIDPDIFRIGKNRVLIGYAMHSSFPYVDHLYEVLHRLMMNSSSLICLMDSNDRLKGLQCVIDVL